MTGSKFFGSGSNGTKPAGQQSKLKFSSNASGTPKKEEVDDEATSGADAPAPSNGLNGHDADADVKMEDAAAVKQESVKVEGSTQVKEEALDEDEAITPASPDVLSRKRPASHHSDDENNVGADTDEPPAKKQRQKAAPTPKAKKGLAVKKTSKSAKPGKPVALSDEEEDEPTSSKASTRPASEHPVSDDDTPDVKKRGKPSPTSKSKTKIAAPAPKAVLAPDDESDEGKKADTASEAESEDEEDEDEKPEVAAKVREKVQSTLKASTNTAYPDWKAGDPVPYAALCTTFSRIEMTSKRLEIIALCSAFLLQVARLTPNDLLPTVLLMVGKLAADYSGIELGIGESFIMKAIGETTGRSLKTIKEDQQKIGDLGLVAAKSRSNQPTMFKPKALTVRSVHEGLLKIATVEGSGAQARKVDGIKKLLSSADVHLAKGQTVDIYTDKGGASESKFIIRALEGKMRLGLADKNLQVALAHAMTAHAVSQDGAKVPTDAEMKKGEEVFKTVYSELPAYEVIVPALLKGGIWKLRDECRLQAGVPLKPMLAKPTKSIGEVLDRFEGKDFTCEYKYDGERAQIHFVAHDAGADQAYAGATIAPAAGKSARGISNIFSRNSEDLSKKYPDILAKLPDWVKEGTKSFVLDCETVAWDVEKKHVLPFQQLMTRKKKDVKVEDVKVKVCVFAFDLLYLNGEALVAKPFRERRERMYSAFSAVEGEFAFAEKGDATDVEAIQVLLEESIKASCEGLMVKMLDGVESHYEPSRRSQNWLKVKKDYLAGTGDSLDLVVLGAYYGKGKRTSVYGAFLLACYNTSTESYESVCNIGTGFSEAILATLYESLSPIVIDRPKPFYTHSPVKNDQPDVWFEPRYVWEVKTADLTLSPRYRAAAEEFGGDGVHKGVSLRFPRFIREREDKKPDGATSSRQVAEMYRNQAVVGKEKKAAADDDFEY